MSSTAFPKILHVGDKLVKDIFDEEVEITEKLDGSQLGFGLINGEVVVRSKGKEQDLDNPDKMFRIAVNYIRSIKDKLTEGVFYYGEYLEAPRHSTLAYDRVPKNNIALFGMMNNGVFMPYANIQNAATALGVDAIPLIYSGKSSPEHVLELVEGVSYLGGAQREGVVIKVYKDWEYLGRLHYTVMSAKYVTEKFKEVHQKDWKKNNTGKGKLETLKSQYRTEARWHKAIQHLKENGQLEGSPRDIGALIKEIRKDLTDEEQENIKTHLWSLFGDDFQRSAVDGFPQWYKEELLKGNVNV